MTLKQLVWTTVALLPASLIAQEPQIPYGTAEWDADSLGNHRAVVRLDIAADAVRARIPWRRPDRDPERKSIVVVDASTGLRIGNVARLNINREYGEIVFQPETVPGDYFVYYLPHVMEGRSNYPTVTYPEPEDAADPEWLRNHGLDPGALDQETLDELPQARIVEFQSVDALNSFWPMEVIATGAELSALSDAHPLDSYLLFPEDRAYPIRMRHDLPQRWIASGPSRPFAGMAARGEFYAFQIGVFAMRAPIEDLNVDFAPLVSEAGPLSIPASAFRCFNLGGIDSGGMQFSRTQPVQQGTVQPLWCGVQIPESATPGDYESVVSVLPAGLPAKTIRLALTISSEMIAAHGDDEPWRHSRLRWLDSRIAFDDETVTPYTPVRFRGDTVGVLGRDVVVAPSGFPASIRSYFSPEVTHLVETGREILSGPVALVVENSQGLEVEWSSDGWQAVREAPGVAVWEASSVADSLTLDVLAEMEFDGTIEFRVAIGALRPTAVRDIRLVIPLRRDVAKYMMGMGHKGGLRPAAFHWEWDVARNQDGAWVGDVNAGLQFSMKDENYVRPLNTNFYHSKPLVMPASWDNDGQGGCRMSEDGDETFLLVCYSGARTIQAGEQVRYDLRLALTPFRPIDATAHWQNRYYHRFEPVSEIRAQGANTINVHHATDINPYINYPFLRPEEMKAYVDEAHANGMKVKIYYTVRELTNRAPELFALRSLGQEIFSTGPGGGFSWLQEHLGEDYIAAWFVPRLKDAAIINSGVSRWHNYYLEGLNWLVKNVGIDGLYIDDVAFDRTTMKRLRKILDRGGPGKLIDLHSANQYNERDGFASSANLYLEHFPFIDRLWFGEYFDYDSSPDFWLIEVSGIPFGLMGEMLQDGGNPWRGMLYGMTNRMPWSGDPSTIWRVWDEFGIEQSRMIGYWSPDAPVTTGREDVLASTYVADGRALVSVASWAADTVDVRLDIDWGALGIDSARATITAPEITDFQPARSFQASGELPIAPGRGWLLIIREVAEEQPGSGS